MERHDPVWTSSCARDRQPGSVGAKCGFACYLLLAVGIWVAYLWLVYSNPVAVAPPLSQTLGGSLSGNGSQSAEAPSTTSAAEGPNRQVGELALQSTVVTPDLRFSSGPASNTISFDTAGHAGRKQLILDIQRVLYRAGCYRGALTGAWDANTTHALGAFLVAANARLPIDKPDDFLLHLVKGHERVSCGEKAFPSVPLTSPPKSGSQLAPPPGLMGIGGPRPEMEASSTKSVSSDTASGHSQVGRPRRGGEKGASGNPPSRVTQGQRTVRDLLLHPLGTF